MTPDDDDSTRPAPDVVDPGIPATSEMPRTVPPGSEDEEEMPLLDVPQGVEDWGTTEREQMTDEPLSLRLRREQPDVVPPATSDVGHRLFEPETDSGLDEEADAVADLDADRSDTLSAEELAMRVEDEPAGLNYDPDPGYLDRD